jgi:hypothetical protein
MDRPTIALSFLTLTLLSGCNPFGASSDQKAAVRALLAASEKCVYDVRDKNLKYDRSPNCTSLGALSQQYINAGGGRLESPLETEIEFERARVHAWMALALSASNGQASNIW